MIAVVAETHFLDMLYESRDTCRRAYLLPYVPCFARCLAVMAAVGIEIDRQEHSAAVLSFLTQIICPICTDEYKNPVIVSCCGKPRPIYQDCL